MLFMWRIHTHASALPVSP